MKDATVAICTWNRAALLDQTLTEFRKLVIPPGVTWELLVVDNNSTDDTSQVLANHAAHLPLVALHEVKQGHSHARNCAVASATGRWIFWTDDDVLVHPEWLAELLRATQAQPEAEFVGGPIRPWFESTPPDWIASEIAVLGFCYALIDHGPTERWLQPGEYAYGANVGFRLEAMQRYPFDPALGRVGKQLSSGDDTRVQDQILTAGGKGLWVPTAAVKHFIPTARMTAEYIREILYWSGYHGIEPFRNDTSRRLFAAPTWMWKTYLKAKLTRRLRRKQDATWVTALRTEAKFAGLIARFREEAKRA
jgi:glucosyl-dolichyl phosphate glucuronosyltransferase